MFVVQEQWTGNYLAPKCHHRGVCIVGKHHWIKNINQARLFSRTCDAKNAIRSQDFDKNYKLIPCLVVSEKNTKQESKYYKVGCKLALVITADGSHFVPKTFYKRADAELYLQLSTGNCNLHKDYFFIEEVVEKPTEPPSRPSWQDYFLGLALLISKRSHDIHTQHGCLLVDSKTKHILATGYNGFPRGMKDNTLPTNRPDAAKPDQDDKYNWMLHSEFNACCNLTRPADGDTVAYVTGEPCTPCLMCLWQHGVTQVIHRNALGSKYLIDEKTRKRRDILLAQTGMKVEAVEADLSWVSAAVSA
jgi:dCMP deaminase